MSKKATQAVQPGKVISLSWLFVIWCCGAAWMVAMALFYPARFAQVDPEVLATSRAFWATAVGVAGGVALVLLYKWWYRSRLEEEARALLDPRQPLQRRLLLLASMLLVITITSVIIYWLMARDSLAVTGLAGIYGVAGMMLLQIFIYSDYRRAMLRAQELAVKARVEANFKLGADRSSYANILGVLTVLATLGAGAWLQWGLPAAALAEPRPYITVQHPSGTAVRLTYGHEAGLPAVSPDGKYVAYVQGDVISKKLRIMRADGSEKRTIPGLNPNVNYPMAWSPDGKRLLVICTEASASEELAVEQLSVLYDLWLVEVTSGKATKLTDTGNIVAARWVGPKRLVVLRGYKEAATVWLMNDQGNQQQTVEEVVLPSWPFAIQPWHGNKDLLAVGIGTLSGVWRIDTATAKATRLANIPALWAVPLNDKEIAVGTLGKARKPATTATSIGVLDTTTGKGRGLTRDLQGALGYPGLASPQGHIFFTQTTDNSLWLMDTKSGKLRPATKLEAVSQPAAAPDGRTLFITARGGAKTEPKAQQPGVWRLELEQQ